MSAPASLSNEIRLKVQNKERITPGDALWLWKNAGDDELRELAQIVRKRFHEPTACTYMLMRIINYTNVCVAQCDYCAFYTLPGEAGGYVLSEAQVFAKIDELLELGGDLVGFNGGFNPQLPLEYYCEMFAAVRARYGAALTPADEKMARTVIAYWIQFAKTGNPNGAGMPEWPRYVPQNDVLMNFTGSGPAAQADPWKERLDLTQHMR